MTDLVPAHSRRRGARSQRCTQARLTVATAESCTGGLIAGVLTEIPGSSAVFDRGFVTYSNEAKIDMLGVPPDLLRQAVRRGQRGGGARHGRRRPRAIRRPILPSPSPASPAPAAAPRKSRSGWSISPCARRDGATPRRQHRFGDLGRSAIRLAAVGEALAMLDDAAQAGGGAVDRVGALLEGRGELAEGAVEDGCPSARESIRDRNS